MAKKNKDIEVRVEDHEEQRGGKTVTVTELTINKKTIGQIVEEDSKTFAIYMGEEAKGKERSLEGAIESLIRDWHLQE